MEHTLNIQAREAVMKMTWDKHLSVGNAVIDSDHRNLMCIAVAIEHAIRANDCPAMTRAFKSFEDWLHVHSANEEKIARAIQYDFSAQKTARQEALKELQLLKDELMARRDALCEGASGSHIASLSVWIAKHIASIDMPMKRALQGFDYKFWPGGREGEANHAAGHIAHLYLKLFDTPGLPSAR